MPKVTEAHLDARRNQILDAAWACFARKGYHQTTMQDICQESGLSPGAIYRYFASKEAILEAIAARSLQLNRALFEVARSEALGPLDALEILGQTMLSFFDDPLFETSARLDVEIRPEFLRNESLRLTGQKQITFWRTALSQLMAEAKDKGQLRPEVDPEALAALAICLWEGIRQFRLLDPDGIKPKACINLLRSLAEAAPPIEVAKSDRVEEAARRFVAPLAKRSRRRGRKEAADVHVPS
ncbi:MAG: TetR/AcrR family transcriptional regulator [Chloroflexi bacterium]|nr:TetR/AcrR family transcriptional regulator [Chloroflexota bacterium]